MKFTQLADLEKKNVFNFSNRIFKVEITVESESNLYDWVRAYQQKTTNQVSMKHLKNKLHTRPQTMTFSSLTSRTPQRHTSNTPFFSASHPLHVKFL